MDGNHAKLSWEIKSYNSRATRAKSPKPPSSALVRAIIAITLVSAPEIKIVDESGREVTERYYKAGSALELTCIAENVGAPEDEQPITWRHGDRTLSEGIR